MREVSISRFGFVVIDVYVRPKNSPTMPPIAYKVDSGAGCTTICADWLLENGYDEEWIKQGRLLEGNARPIMASGLTVEDCYEIILPEIHIGDWVGYNWPVITSLSVPFKFLLGTDSMQFFNWNFDYEHGVCRFDLIHGKRRLLFNQQEQSIHAIEV